MTAQLCLEGVLKEHESRYSWQIRMVHLHLVELILSGDALTVSSDDIAAYLPKLGIPKDADTRWTAAVWRMGGWTHDGYQRSTRCVNHHRAISRFRRGPASGQPPK